LDIYLRADVSAVPVDAVVSSRTGDAGRGSSRVHIGAVRAGDGHPRPNLAVEASRTDVAGDAVRRGAGVGRQGAVEACVTVTCRVGQPGTATVETCNTDTRGYTDFK